jgi:hypothetical protein
MFEESADARSLVPNSSRSRYVSADDAFRAALSWRPHLPLSLFAGCPAPIGSLGGIECLRGGWSLVVSCPCCRFDFMWCCLPSGTSPSFASRCLFLVGEATGSVRHTTVPHHSPTAVDVQHTDDQQPFGFPLLMVCLFVGARARRCLAHSCRDYSLLQV